MNAVRARGGARQFRTVSQGMKYDETAELATRWLPELSDLPTELKHKPWLRSSSKGGDESRWDSYPSPIIDPGTQLTRADHVGVDS
jgi:deoxyribodipyrimidine photolyase